MKRIISLIIALILICAISVAEDKTASIEEEIKQLEALFMVKASELKELDSKVQTKCCDIEDLRNYINERGEKINPERCRELEELLERYENEKLELEEQVKEKKIELGNIRSQIVIRKAMIEYVNGKPIAGKINISTVEPIEEDNPEDFRYIIINPE